MDQWPDGPSQPEAGGESSVDGGTSAMPNRPEVSIASRPIQSHPGIAWLIIIGLLSYLVWQSNETPVKPMAHEGVSMQSELAGRILVACSQLLSPDWNDFLVSEADLLKHGHATADLLAYVVLLAEFKGSAEALEILDHIERGETLDAKTAVSAKAPTAPPTEADRQSMALLRRILQANIDGKNAGLSKAEQRSLEDNLGWFGKLAPLTKGTTNVDGRKRLLASMGTLPIVLVGVTAWYLICGIAGAALLVTLLVLSLMRRLRRGFGGGSGDGGIYAETFAAWVVLWVGMRELVARLEHGQRGVGLQPSPHVQITLSIVAALLALSALFWPVLRGVPWAKVRQDIGLKLPRRILAEPVFGLMTYCSSLPLLAAGLGVMRVLTEIQNRISPGAPPPSHPAQELLMGADWTTTIEIMILGVVVAPFCEEIMFRGVMYRHLRDATTRMGLVLSMIISAMVSSFIFAAIHPQGWVMIPVLMGLASGFCLAREWRGSLMAGMIAHGITNFVTLLLTILLFRGG